MKTDKIYIIAEAGVNHNGSLKTAKRLVDAAVTAGVNAIKFQTFRAECVVVESAEKATYQMIDGENESQLEMLKKLELSESSFCDLFEYCKVRDIQFLSTAFDHSSIDFIEKLGVPCHKIPSGEITNLPYLRHICKIGKPVIISTGMATIEEIEETLNVFLKAGMSYELLTVLHCNTQYPTSFSDVNLKAMLTIGERFPGINVGYSDHTLGIEVPIAAAALGAKIIEKHFTLDRGMAGPDHGASLEPGELKRMVSAIRNIEEAMGDGQKRPSQSELENIPLARRSIVASEFINKGEVFTEKNLAVKRPGFGMSAMCWDDVIGKIAKRNFIKDDLIEISEFD
jgi:N,N'-diacetyllegionaminate synthase